MEEDRFDRLTKTIGRARTRRGFLATVAAGIGLVGLRRSVIAAPGLGSLCGGIFGFSCNEGEVCGAAPGGGCTPSPGNDSCIGFCRPVSQVSLCASARCGWGTECCEACGGVCLPTGTPCQADACGWTQCGPATCGPGEWCCNESCGICSPIGSACTLQYCFQECGNTICRLDEVCCEACSVCAPQGTDCSRLTCEPIGAGEPCGDVTCFLPELCCNPLLSICTLPDAPCPF